VFVFVLQSNLIRIESIVFEENSQVEIFIELENKTLAMKKYERGCDFCGEMKDSIEYNGKKICKSCAKELYEKAEGKEELF